MSFDAAAATARHMAALSPAELARAADYTVGGHWLLLWGMLVTAVAAFIIVRTGLLERLNARLERHRWFLRSWIVAGAAMLAMALMALPWSIYEEWARETSYGRTTQPLADFLMQTAIGIAITTVMGGLFFVGVYALIRRTGARWWLWSGGFTAAVTAAILLLSPTLIEPLFNTYAPLPAGPVRNAVEVLADDAGIPHDRIFVFDGSRQSENFTANVSGIMGSARIAISDVALGDASLDEVKAVTGHEIGHYILYHAWRFVAVAGVLAILVFYLTNRMFAPVARAFGSKATIGDATGLPIVMTILTILGTLALPITNGVTRLGEREADDYSLDHVGLPDALASALVKTAEYRDPRPSVLQEAVFYSHPSVEWRVRNAMDWQAAHPERRIVAPRLAPPTEAP
jgi:STE24 endopeptidase